MSHVRSAGTSTPAGQSRAELERLLDRYGCSRSGSELDREAQTLTVWFTVPDSKSVKRVAWRHVVFLVEAGLVAAEAGVKRISEFFLADTVVKDLNGRDARLVDFLDSAHQEWRALIGKGGSDG